MEFKIPKSPLTKETERVIEYMSHVCPDDERYTTCAKNLGEMYRVRDRVEGARISINPNGVLNIVASLVSTLLIVHLERTDIVGRSKSWGERPKIRL